MSSWTLERAKNQLSEVVRRALAHEPQFVTRGGRDAVVVIATEDYERLTAPPNLFDFLRDSPITNAIACGELPEDAFERRPELPRDIDL
jgi:prevent-host-death family protein